MRFFTFRSPGVIGALSLDRLNNVLLHGLPRTSNDTQNYDIFVSALWQVLTQEILQSWRALYLTSRIHCRMLHSLYAGLLLWANSPQCRSSAALKLRIVLRFGVPLLEAVYVE